MEGISRWTDELGEQHERRVHIPDEYLAGYFISLQVNDAQDIQAYTEVR